MNRPSVPLARELDGTHPLVVVRTDDEDSLRDELFSSLRADVTYRRWTAVRGLGDGRIEGHQIPDTDHPAAALAWLATRSGAARSVNVFHDLSGHLDDPRTRRALKEAVSHLRGVFGVLVLVDREPRLPDEVAADAHRWELPSPGPAELEHAIREALREARKTRSVAVEVTRSTLDAMVRGLHGLTRRQAKRLVLAAATEDNRFDATDIDRLVVLKRNALGDAGGVLEFVRGPVSLDEIGGMASLKRWLALRKDALSDKALAFGLRAPRGVLLLGVQGAGKSLAAKAIATAWGVPLLRLDAGALYDKFVGESERKLRDSLAQADRMAPAVLWIDEIEKGFAAAASQSSDGGLSRRMFGTLLTWMQERSSPTFLAATANDVSALPPELLRKGRFDEIFFVDLPNEEARRAILSIHLAGRGRRPEDFDLPRLAAACEGFSGAEIEAAIEAALYRAFAENARDLRDDDLAEAFAASPPLSTVMAERVAELRAWASERCAPAE